MNWEIFCIFYSNLRKFHPPANTIKHDTNARQHSCEQLLIYGFHGMERMLSCSVTCCTFTLNFRSNVYAHNLKMMALWGYFMLSWSKHCTSFWVHITVFTFAFCTSCYLLSKARYSKCMLCNNFVSLCHTFSLFLSWVQFLIHVSYCDCIMIRLLFYHLEVLG